MVAINVLQDRRCLLSTLTRTRLLLLIAWLLSAVGAILTPQSTSAEDIRAEDILAERAKAILTRRCFQCHGSNGVARKNVFVLDRDRLVSSKVVVPGDVNSLLLRVVESGAMPMGGPELTAEEKADLRSWVREGANGWSNQSHSSPQTILSERAVLALIRSDLVKAQERTRPYLRYLSLAHLHSAGASDEEMETYRAALAKLINSLSWHREITPPAPVDSARTVFRIDLRDYNWTAETWNTVLSMYPYGVRTAEGQAVAQLSGAALPYARADWFVATASIPPLYHDLLGLPNTVRELERLLGIDAARNLSEEKNVVRAGVRNSGVSQNNRVLERHASQHGAYWKSYDFRSNQDDQNIFKDPLRLNAAGGEIIFNLPNGLQAYFLTDSAGTRIDRAPVDIVSDRSNPDEPVIQNGRSCMGCHYAGMKSFKDDVLAVVKNAVAVSYDRDKALALYPRQEALDQLIDKDSEQFRRVVEQTGSRASVSAATEPINALARRFLAELSVAQAAAEAGMGTSEFQARVQASARLMSLGYGQLLVADGGFKRDAWDKNFGELAGELQLGQYAPGNLISRGAVVRNAAVNFNRSINSASISKTDPNEIMREARTVHVWSGSMFITSDVLEDELRKRPEFQAMGLVIVKDRNAADLEIQLDRPLFTFTFTFSATNPQKSVLVTIGKVTAIDGNSAAPKIAKELLKRLKAARSPEEPAKKK